MADKNLATYTSLDVFRGIVRTNLGNFNEQESLIFDDQINDQIYSSCVMVRMAERKILDKFFSTNLVSSKGEFAEYDGFIKIDGLDIVDLFGVTLWDTERNLLIPLKNDRAFSTLKALYGSHPTACFGRISSSKLAADTTLQIEVHRGASLAIPSTGISDASNVNPVLLTFAAELPANYADGDYVFISGSEGNLGINGVRAILGIANDRFSATLDHDGTYDGAYVPDTATIKRIPPQELNYQRLPRRVSLKTEFIDMPESHCPIAEDLATIAVARLLTREVPKDIEARVVNWTKLMAGNVGVDLTETRH